MGFDGQLGERSTIDAFHEVLDGRKSGNLVVKKGEDEYRFHFIFAAITGVEGASFPRTYRELLASRGKADRETLDQIAARFPVLGEFDTELVKRDYVSRKDLKELHVDAIKESMWRTFPWRSGTFVFTDVKPPKELGALELSLPTADILLEGIRRLEDISIVEHGLRDRLHMRIKAPHFQRIEAQMKSLRPEEGFILSRIDGTVNVEQVCDLSSLPKEQTQKVVFGLVAAGLLEFDEPPAPRRESPPAFVRGAAAPTAAPSADRDTDDADVDFDLSGVGLKDDAPETRPAARAPQPPPAAAAGRDRKSGAIPRPAPPKPDDSDDGPMVDGMTPRERKAKARESLETGKKFVEKEKWAGAVPHLKEAARLSEKDPEAWLLLGTALAKVPGSRKEAEEALMKSIDLNHKNPEPYIELGFLYKELGNEHKARVQFQNALHWDPAHEVARAEMKKEGMSELKENITEALGGVKDQVSKLFDALKTRKK